MITQAKSNAAWGHAAPLAGRPPAGSAEWCRIIRPSTGWRAVDLSELWRYRELLYFLTWRDIKVRYKQTLLGAAWAVFQPLLTMVVFTLFFRKLAKIPCDGPYPLFSYAALLPWTYFANAVTSASNSLVGSSNLITKVYFPRVLVPASAVLAGLVDYAIALVVLLSLMFWYRLVPSPWIALTLPLLTLLTVGLALGLGLWLSALNARYRDVRYAVPFALQLWMFITPVVYPLRLVPAAYRWVVAMNPMAGIIEAFRAAVLGGACDRAYLGVSVLAVALLVTTGLFYFRRLERTFADVI